MKIRASVWMCGSFCVTTSWVQIIVLARNDLHNCDCKKPKGNYLEVDNGVVIGQESACSIVLGLSVVYGSFLSTDKLTGRYCVLQKLQKLTVLYTGIPEIRQRKILYLTYYA